jgi:urease accessory protein
MDKRTGATAADGEVRPVAVGSPMLWQLISPTLPVGAYAYSDGFEYAVEAGWVNDEAGTHDWLVGLGRHTLGQLDLPILLRLYEAWRLEDYAAVTRWNAWLLAARETRELRDAECQLGRALVKVLDALVVANTHIDELLVDDEVGFATAFSLACKSWKIPCEQALAGYMWSWSEARVAAAVKLVPLGQTAGQRILQALGLLIPAVVEHAFHVEDAEIGAAAPALALASASHEHQHTRLFRS